MRALLAALLLLLVLGAWPLGTLAQSGGASCNSFPNQASAQAAYRANPAALGSLDRDRDGVACESLPCPCDPPRPTSGSSGGSNGGAQASATSAPAYIFVAPTLPPQPTGIPSSARWVPATSRGAAGAGAPAFVSDLAGPLPPSPPREPAIAAPAPSGFVDLADIWMGRDGVLVVQADGQAQLLWWEPRACAAEAAEPCERGADLQGRAALALRWRDAARVVAEVQTTTDDRVVVSGVAILRLRPDGVLELWPAGQDGPRAYCNERLWREQPAVAREACGNESSARAP